jgi:hypothetical protein
MLFQTREARTWASGGSSWVQTNSETMAAKVRMATRGAIREKARDLMKVTKNQENDV